jgi:hypothetical protein
MDSEQDTLADVLEQGMATLDMDNTAKSNKIGYAVESKIFREGENISFAQQITLSDPEQVLVQHLESMRLLLKVLCLHVASRTDGIHEEATVYSSVVPGSKSGGLDPLQCHGIRIGSIKICLFLKLTWHKCCSIRMTVSFEWRVASCQLPTY